MWTPMERLGDSCRIIERRWKKEGGAERGKKTTRQRNITNVPLQTEIVVQIMNMRERKEMHYLQVIQEDTA